MPWLADVITVLEDANVGTFGSNIFASTQASIPILPSGAATCHLIETGGTAPDHTQNKTAIYPAYSQPGCQLTFRAGTYQQARDMADEAFQALFIRNRFINSGWYVWVKALQEPSDGGKDARGQAQVGFNIVAKYNRRGN